MSRDLLEKFTRHRPNFHKSAPQAEIRDESKKPYLQSSRTDDKPVTKKSLGYRVESSEAVMSRHATAESITVKGLKK